MVWSARVELDGGRGWVRTLLAASRFFLVFGFYLLFLAIAIGLGFGADQGTVTTISFALILLLFFIHKKVISTKEKSDNVYLSVVLPKADAERSAEVTEIVTSHISNAKIKRLELSKECAEMVYLVNMTNYSELEAIRNELNTISEEITYSFVEEANVF